MESFNSEPGRSGEEAIFFDSIADKWDGMQDITKLTDTLKKGLLARGTLPDEHIIDIGCGTGNSTAVILEILSENGRITAIDISKAMIEKAKSKIKDSRATFYVTSVNNIPAHDSSIDRAICYSVWPHVRDQIKAIREISRVLKPGGAVHIWHTVSRATVNEIHAGIPGTVGNDRLPPASEVADLLRVNGFDIIDEIDNTEQYLVSGIKKEL